MGAEICADSAAISCCVASRKVVCLCPHASSGAARCSAGRRFPDHEMTVCRDQMLDARGLGEALPRGNRCAKQRAQCSPARCEASWSAATNESQCERQPHGQVAERERQPPRQNSRRGKLRRVFDEARGSACSVARCPALPHEAGRGVAAGSTRVVRIPDCCRLSAQLKPTRPPPITTALVGICVTSTSVA